MDLNIIILFAICVQTSRCMDSAYYTAAVIEYHPADSRFYTPAQRTIENAKNYVELLRSINETIDIAVFPEDTITHGIFSNDRKGILNISPVITNVDGTVIPCEVNNKYPEYFIKLSCIARELRTYLVINIVEKSVCSTDTLSDTTKCATDNWNLYNANVVFDRNGAVIARYRKFHLFREAIMNVTKKAELSTFTTDFGVTFGIFTCFDIMFEEPSLLLVRQNIKHFVYPSFWFSESPFLTAMQSQNMWAVSTDAVLLASGANEPFIGTGGSGIYAGRNGPLAMGTVTHDGNKIFVSKIPRNPEKTAVDGVNKIRKNSEIDKIGADMDSFHLLTDKISVYNTTLIQGNVDTKLCYGDFCCHFNVIISKNKTTTDNFYRYRMVVYSGNRKYDGTRNNAIQVCAVISCKDNTVNSCGHRILPYDSIEWPTRFNKIILTGTYSNVENKMQYPSTLLSDIQPLSSDSYEWKSVSLRGNKFVERTIKLPKPQDRLMTFGIYGRDFGRDDVESFLDKFGTESV